MRVDGDLSEWTDASAFVEQDGLRIAVRNDTEFLYVALTTVGSEKEVRQPLRGLTVWFDNEGGKSKHAGIRYPLFTMPEAYRGDLELRERSTPRDRNELFSEMLAEFEWLGPKEDDIERVPKLNNNEVAVDFTRSLEGFGYELKIPLRATGRRLYAIGAESGSRIGLAIEVGGMPAVGRSPAAGGAGGSGRPGGRPGRGERPPGGAPPGETPPGGEPGAAPRMKTEITWFRVELAKP